MINISRDLLTAETKWICLIGITNILPLPQSSALPFFILLAPLFFLELLCLQEVYFPLTERTFQSLGVGSIFVLLRGKIFRNFREKEEEGGGGGGG